MRERTRRDRPSYKIQIWKGVDDYVFMCGEKEIERKVIKRQTSKNRG
jgi:hypothetical protein